MDSALAILFLSCPSSRRRRRARAGRRRSCRSSYFDMSTGLWPTDQAVHQSHSGYYLILPLSIIHLQFSLTVHTHKYFAKWNRVHSTRRRFLSRILILSNSSSLRHWCCIFHLRQNVVYLCEFIIERLADSMFDIYHISIGKTFCRLFYIFLLSSSRVYTACCLSFSCYFFAQLLIETRNLSLTSTPSGKQTDCYSSYWFLHQLLFVLYTYRFHVHTK